MPERRRRPDLDERFTVPPMEGEDLLRRLLEPTGEPCEDEELEGEEP
jgi:hypothetical protein